MSFPLRRAFVAVVAVAAVGAGGYVLADRIGLTSSPDGEGAAASTGATPTPVSTEPPPAEDVATDAPAPAPSEPSEPGGETPGADVVLTFAGWEERAGAVEVSGFVADASGDGGTCTATLTRGSKVVTASAAAVANAGTMACGGLLVPRDDLSSGAWDAVLAYESSHARGQSSAVRVDVP